MDIKDLNDRWYLLESNLEKMQLEEELKRELNSDHILYGVGINPIARRNDCDDVIFKTSENHYALVHLTWSGKREIDSNFPFTMVFKNLEELINEANQED